MATKKPMRKVQEAPYIPMPPMAEDEMMEGEVQEAPRRPAPRRKRPAPRRK